MKLLGIGAKVPRTTNPYLEKRNAFQARERSAD